nr:MAG TPA: hypothetical protein [Caudoviricetes sp.]DAN56471.1 MAG TPA: hypothetical protein [Bacteriophage sp.]DAY36488.1 MAG TPA: hypothetical protein [Bacteriophage sp.]
MSYVRKNINPVFMLYYILNMSFNNTDSLDMYITTYLQRYMFSTLYPIPIDNSLV